MKIRCLPAPYVPLAVTAVTLCRSGRIPSIMIFAPAESDPGLPGLASQQLAGWPPTNILSRKPLVGSPHQSELRESM